MANGWFRKQAGGDRRPPDDGPRETAGDIPEGMWIKCPKCRDLLFAKELERNLKVCTKCGYHFRLTARERIDLLLDPGSFVEHDAGLASVNPLDFPDYTQKLEEHRRRTGMSEAVLSGEGALEGQMLTLAVTDFHFMGGSMGSVVGERITRAVERATKVGVPTLLISGTGGGARQQEGLLALMQMAKTSAALARHHDAGLLAVVLLTDMSLAGVMASWGSLGDVMLAEPGAKIGFAGERVSQQAQVMKVPADFQTAEFHLAHGQLDKVVQRKDLRDTIARVMRFAGAPVKAEIEEPALATG